VIVHYTFIARWRWQPPYDVLSSLGSRQTSLVAFAKSSSRIYRVTRSSLLSSTIGHIHQTVDALVDQTILNTIIDVFLFVVAAVFYVRLAYIHRKWKYGGRCGQTNGFGRRYVSLSVILSYLTFTSIGTDFLNVECQMSNVGPNLTDVLLCHRSKK